MRVSENDINMVRNSPVTLRKGMEGQGINEIFLKEEIFFLPIMLIKQAASTCIYTLVSDVNTCLVWLCSQSLRGSLPCFTSWTQKERWRSSNGVISREETEAGRMTDGTALQKQGRDHRASPRAPSSVLTSCSPDSQWLHIHCTPHGFLTSLSYEAGYERQTRCGPHERPG